MLYTKLKLYLLVTIFPIIINSYLFLGFINSTNIVSIYNSKRISIMIEDELIKNKIRTLYTKNYIYNFIRTVSYIVVHGRVLIAGQVIDQLYKSEAEKLLYLVTEIKDVINEIHVSDKLLNSKSDIKILYSIKISVLLQLNLRTLEYNVIVYNGRVYMLGIAKNIKQIEILLKTLSRIQNINSIRNYIFYKI